MENEINTFVKKFIKVYPTPIDMILSGSLTENNTLGDVVINFLEDESVDLKKYFKPVVNELIDLGYGEAMKEF
jgi:hypothetical protein